MDPRPRNETLAPLMLAIQALDVPGVTRALVMSRKTGLWDEEDVFGQLWRSAHREGAHSQIDRNTRDRAAADILHAICDAGFNPLLDNQMALAPYVSDWATEKGAWKNLEALVNENGFKTPAGGGWLHALCENGAFNLRAIHKAAEQRGYPNTSLSGSADFWTKQDNNGLTPLEVFWWHGGWEERGTRACGIGMPPGEAAVLITQWCKSCGMNPEQHAPRLTEGMRHALDSSALQTETSQNQLLRLLAQWRRERLSSLIGGYQEDNADETRAL